MQPLLTATCDPRNLCITKTFSCIPRPLRFLFAFPRLVPADKAPAATAGSEGTDCHHFLLQQEPRSTGHKPTMRLGVGEPCAGSLCSKDTRRTVTGLKTWRFGR